MGFYADPWLREARNKIDAHPEQTSGANNWSTADFEKISEAVEKAIKAALVERHGSIPQQHDHKKLVSLCQTTGVWDVLPPALKSLVEEVESYRAANASDAHGSGTSSPEQLQNTLSLHAGLSTTWNITLSETTRFSDASKSLKRTARGWDLTIRFES